MKLLKKLKIYGDSSCLVDAFAINSTDRNIFRFILYILLLFTAFNYLSNGFFMHILTSSTDYELVYHAGRKINEGNAHRIYDDFFAYRSGRSGMMYMYPALVAVIYSPLSLFEFYTAKIILMITTQLFVFISFFLLLKNLGTLKSIEKLICFFIFFNFYPGFFTLQLGQSEYFLLTFFLLFIYYFQTQKDIYSTFFLSLVIYCKIFPILFVLYFLWKREYRYCALLVSMLILMGGFSLLFVNFATQKQYFQHILTFTQIDSFIDHQSITGFFSRLLTKTIFSDGWLDSNLLKNIFIYSSSFIILLFTGYATKKRLNRNDEQYKYEFSIIIIGMLLLSRITDTHHLLFLLIPFNFLFVYYIRQKKFYTRDVIILGSCYAFFATYVPIVAMKLLDLKVCSNFTRGISILLPLLSLPFYALLILWLLNLNMLLKYETNKSIKK